MVAKASSARPSAGAAKTRALAAAPPAAVELQREALSKCHHYGNVLTRRGTTSMGRRWLAERGVSPLTGQPLCEIIMCAALRSTFTRNIMRVKCGPAARPFYGVFSFSLRFGTTMEQIGRADHISVICDEVIEPRSAKIDPASIERIGRALAAAVNNLDEARQALGTICAALPESAGDAVRSFPVLLTVRETCKILGYHKTKVYELMKRGLLPYVVETRTGHRRIEYRAVQQLVKRLRAGRLERKAS
jgi:excisionase family DNA binding protein